MSENSPREVPTKGFHSAAAAETGEKGRVRAESFAYHYSQARQFYHSQTLSIIGKMKDTLMGRAIGILVADGSDGAVIEKMIMAATDAGAVVKIVAPKVGGWAIRVGLARSPTRDKFTDFSVDCSVRSLPAPR